LSECIAYELLKELTRGKEISIEEIRKFVKGHNLYNALELRNIENYDKIYINDSKEDIFKDILEFLDKQRFFSGKRKKGVRNEENIRCNNRRLICECI